MRTKTWKSLRGPNIGAPPTNDPMPEQIIGVVGIKVGDKITTDHIMPAGARLKYRSNVPEYSKYVFEHIDKAFPTRAMEAKKKGLQQSLLQANPTVKEAPESTLRYAQCTLASKQS